MTGSDLFGASIDGDDVEAALLAHLRKWMDSYVGNVVREKDPTSVLWPEGVAPVTEYSVKHASAENWPAERLPMLLAHCPGFGAPPKREGDGRVTGYFLVHLSAIAQGVDIADTKKLARLYATAATMAVLQKPDLGGFANETLWMDQNNFGLAKGQEAERALMAVANTFLIEVTGIMDLTAGPDAPLENPSESPGERPVAKTVGEEVRPGKAAVDLLREGGHFDPE